MTEKLDRMFLRLALGFASLSKDPSTKVGAVIVSPEDQRVVSSGFNSFPNGVAETAERLNDRDTKMRLVVHAELNAVLKAARRGIALGSCTMYIAATDAVTDAVWGGPPCTRCLVDVIQAGIIEVVSYPRRTAPSRWACDLEYALGIAREAGVRYREIPVELSPLLDQRLAAIDARTPECPDLDQRYEGEHDECPASAELARYMAQVR